MSYEILIQENKNDIIIDENENEEDCINIENKIILLGNENSNNGDYISCASSDVDLKIENDNSYEESEKEIKYINKINCNQCVNHLNKRRIYNQNDSLDFTSKLITTNNNNNNSSKSYKNSHEDDFINCMILFIAGFILFLPWLFTFHYLGSPFRKCRVIAIISICLLGLFFIIFTILLSTIVVLLSNPELLTMLQKYWLESNYNNNNNYY